MDPQLTEDEERFMRWLEDADVEGHHADGSALPQHWHLLRHETDKLGDLLRAHFPASLEPPDAETFNQRVRDRLS